MLSLSLCVFARASFRRAAKFDTTARKIIVDLAYARAIIPLICRSLFALAATRDLTVDQTSSHVLLLLIDEHAGRQQSSLPVEKSIYQNVHGNVLSQAAFSL